MNDVKYNTVKYYNYICDKSKDTVNIAREKFNDPFFLRRLIAALAAVAALLLFYFMIQKITWRIWHQKIFYYADSCGRLVMEKKETARSFRREKDILYTLNELFSGPESVFLQNVFPPGSRITGALLYRGRLYLNANRELFTGITPQNEKNIIMSVVMTINKNFHSVKEIQFLFNGRVLNHAAGVLSYKNPLVLKKNQN
ncbi:MAG TPA: hypothetical protein DC049_20365 [Spirochaetia bacterium]|nr:hypothetical protein [Spirochaetia bacterium]